MNDTFDKFMDRLAISIPAYIIDNADDFNKIGEFYSYELNYAKEKFNENLNKYKIKQIISGLRERGTNNNSVNPITKVNGYEMLLIEKND